MKKYVVLVAGGMGKRMGSDVPKQFLTLLNKPIIVYAIDAFLSAFPDVNIIIVFNKKFQMDGQTIIKKYFPNQNFHFVDGGETRFHSVQNGLKCVEGEAVVFVHDAVRAMLTPVLIKHCYEQTIEKGSAIPAIISKDSVRFGKLPSPKVLDRSELYLIQTPQTFLSKIILPAFNVEYQEQFTDEATVVEHFGESISLIKGEDTNIKITTPIDVIIAEEILKGRNNN